MLHCTEQHCTMLHCTEQHCTVLLETCAVMHPCHNHRLCIDQPLQRHDATERKPSATVVLPTGNAAPTQPVRKGSTSERTCLALCYHCIYCCRLTSLGLPTMLNKPLTVIPTNYTVLQCTALHCTALHCRLT